MQLSWFEVNFENGKNIALFFMIDKIFQKHPILLNFQILRAKKWSFSFQKYIGFKIGLQGASDGFRTYGCWHMAYPAYVLENAQFIL
jgi:hypothetical protein